MVMGRGGAYYLLHSDPIVALKKLLNAKSAALQCLSQKNDKRGNEWKRVATCSGTAGGHKERTERDTGSGGILQPKIHHARHADF